MDASSESVFHVLIVVVCWGWRQKKLTPIESKIFMHLLLLVDTRFNSLYLVVVFE